MRRPDHDRLYQPLDSQSAAPAPSVAEQSEQPARGQYQPRQSRQWFNDESARMVTARANQYGREKGQ